MVELTVGYYSAVDEEKRWISMWQEYHGLCPHCKEGNDSSTPKLGVGCQWHEGQIWNSRDDGNYQHVHLVENMKYKRELKGYGQ